MKKLAPLAVFLLGMTTTVVLAYVFYQPHLFHTDRDGEGANAPFLERPPLPELEFPELAISPEWLAERLGEEGLRLLDARPAEAYAEGHLPGALRLSLPTGCVTQGVTCVQDELAGLGLAGYESLVLYGDAADPGQLAYLFWLVEWAGFLEVRILEGGAPAWQGELSSEVPKLPATSFVQSPREEAVADVRWMQDHFGLEGIEVLDLRDEGIWMENDYEAPPRFSAGHIPYSLPYDFRVWLADGTWPAPADAWERLRDLGPRRMSYIKPTADFAVYAEGPDTRLGLAYLLLRQMGASVRVFADGWETWSSDMQANPMVRIISAPELAELLEPDNPGLTGDELPTEVAVFDLREQRDFDKGHVPGAICLPENRFALFVDNLFEENWPGRAPSESTLVVYCYGRSCIRSRNASNDVARHGFREILWFREGFDGWEAADLSVARAEGEG